MYSLNRKLRSKAGASITFALLLFLVCAVLSSITIAAASTVAGRMANMAQSDQRYYSVTSACELLKHLIDGKVVTVVTVKKQEKTEAGANKGEPVTQNYLIEGMEGEQAAVSYGEADKIENAGNSIVKDAVKDDPVANKNITISGLPDDALKPTISESVDSDYNITLNVSHKNVGNPFAMQMIFESDVSESSSTREERTEDAEGNIRIEEIDISTRTIRWTLGTVKIVSGSGAGA